MEPISSYIAGYTTGKLTEIAESMVRTHVIERWGRFRAKQFFDAFCGAIASEGTTELELQQLLNDLLSDDRRSQVLFDAYRSVCFTKSRSLGPRIIALLTAELVTRESVADDEEAAIFSAAEELSDAELAEFSTFALDHANRTNTDDTSTCHRSLSINMGEELIDSTWRREIDISLGPLNLATTDIGSWALKLKRHGLISDDVRERHIDEPGTMRQVTWWLYLHPSALRLAELTKQAS
ncbi:MAG: hypothetical protein CDV28_11121 [Candidatus Electronema aureum]|uniref:Uncharacterized protein n=1 Tax=Candidatus Electronema aureum TaxID=2005002 RepID=A0A521G256_9BACT|nr:MAG: hypothetical protein CDV28_11121 [Candidatus Electronema aureum]